MFRFVFVWESIQFSSSSLTITSEMAALKDILGSTLSRFQVGGAVSSSWIQVKNPQMRVKKKSVRSFNLLNVSLNITQMEIF